MIATAKQAAVSRRRREELLRTAAQAEAGKDASYLELASDIGRELEEYEAIRDGRLSQFGVSGLDMIGEALVKARLARGWTQRRLAEALGVTEQAVQKDEARLYGHAGLSRLAEIADVLGYDLEGSFSPVA